MRRNVDLTSGRHFQDESSQGHKESLLTILATGLNVKKRYVCPWNVDSIIGDLVGSDLELSDCKEHRDVILTGDKETRASKRLAYEEESGEYCYRCGRPLTDFDKGLNYGICRRCCDSIDPETNNTIRDVIKTHRFEITPKMLDDIVVNELRKL